MKKRKLKKEIAVEDSGEIEIENKSSASSPASSASPALSPPVSFSKIINSKRKYKVSGNSNDKNKTKDKNNNNKLITLSSSSSMIKEQKEKDQIETKNSNSNIIKKMTKMRESNSGSQISSLVKIRSLTKIKSLSTMTCPNQNTDDESELLEKDAKFRSYTSQVEKSLKNFEYTTEWPDLIAALKNLNKVISSNKGYSVIPKKYLISKRLAQCLHPSLPSGVHLKTLETYHLIFSTIGKDNLKKDLYIYTAGLFPLYTYALITVKPELLSIYETYFVPLGPGLEESLEGFLIGILSGMEDGSDFYERTTTLLNSISASNPINFNTTLWKITENNPATRLPSLKYFIHTKKATATSSSTTTSTSASSASSSTSTTPTAEHAGNGKFDSSCHNNVNQLQPPPSAITVNSSPASSCPATNNFLREDRMIIEMEKDALMNCLKDEDILVQRASLELIATLFPLHSDSVDFSTKRDLMEASLGILLRRDTSLNRRFFNWILGQEAKIDNYYEKFSRNLLLEATLKCLDSHEDSFRIITNLIDKPEIDILDSVLISVLHKMALRSTPRNIATLFFSNLNFDFINNFGLDLLKKLAGNAGVPGENEPESDEDKLKVTISVSSPEICLMLKYLLENELISAQLTFSKILSSISFNSPGHLYLIQLIETITKLPSYQSIVNFDFYPLFYQKFASALLSPPGVSGTPGENEKNEKVLENLDMDIPSVFLQLAEKPLETDFNEGMSVEDFESARQIQFQSKLKTTNSNNSGKITSGKNLLEWLPVLNSVLKFCPIQQIIKPLVVVCYLAEDLNSIETLITELQEEWPTEILDFLKRRTFFFEKITRFLWRLPHGRLIRRLHSIAPQQVEKIILALQDNSRLRLILNECRGQSIPGPDNFDALVFSVIDTSGDHFQNEEFIKDCLFLGDAPFLLDPILFVFLRESGFATGVLDWDTSSACPTPVTELPPGQNGQTPAFPVALDLSPGADKGAGGDTILNSIKIENCENSGAGAGELEKLEKSGDFFNDDDDEESVPETPEIPEIKVSQVSLNLNMPRKEENDESKSENENSGENFYPDYPVILRKSKSADQLDNMVPKEKDDFIHSSVSSASAKASPVPPDFLFTKPRAIHPFHTQIRLYSHPYDWSVILHALQSLKKLLKFPLAMESIVNLAIESSPRVKEYGRLRVVRKKTYVQILTDLLVNFGVGFYSTGSSVSISDEELKGNHQIQILSWEILDNILERLEESVAHVIGCKIEKRALLLLTATVFHEDSDSSAGKDENGNENSPGKSPVPAENEFFQKIQLLQLQDTLSNSATSFAGEKTWTEEIFSFNSKSYDLLQIKLLKLVTTMIKLDKKPKTQANSNIIKFIPNVAISSQPLFSAAFQHALKREGNSNIMHTYWLQCLEEILSYLEGDLGPIVVPVILEASNSLEGREKPGENHTNHISINQKNLIFNASGLSGQNEFDSGSGMDKFWKRIPLENEDFNEADEYEDDKAASASTTGENGTESFIFIPWRKRSEDYLEKILSGLTRITEYLLAEIGQIETVQKSGLLYSLIFSSSSNSNSGSNSTGKPSQAGESSGVDQSRLSARNDFFSIFYIVFRRLVFLNCDCSPRIQNRIRTYLRPIVENYTEKFVSSLSQIGSHFDILANGSLIKIDVSALTFDLIKLDKLTTTISSLFKTLQKDQQEKILNLYQKFLERSSNSGKIENLHQILGFIRDTNSANPSTSPLSLQIMSLLSGHVGGKAELKDFQDVTSKLLESVSKKPESLDILISNLDLINNWGMEEKDKVLPLLTSMIYNLAPHLKRTSSSNPGETPGFSTGEFYPGVVRFFSKLSNFSYTRKAWKKELFEHLMDPSFFKAGQNLATLKVWMTTYENLFSQDSAFSELIARVSVSVSSLNIFSSKELEYETRANLIKRLAFVIYSARKDYFAKSVQSIQERLAEALKIQTPIIQSSVLFCFRVLILRFSPSHLTALWPIIVFEILQVLNQLENEPIEEKAVELTVLHTNVRKLLYLCDNLPPQELPVFQIYRWALVGKAALVPGESIKQDSIECDFLE